MSSAWQGHWEPEAEGDLRRIPWQDAAAIVRDVNAFIEHGIGDVRLVTMPSGARARVLYVPGFRVGVSFDRRTRTIHVWGVWRAPHS